MLPKGALATDRASLRSRYTKGSGWWKRPFAEGWPGWVTGTTGPVVMKMTVTEAEEPLAAPFAVSVRGSDRACSRFRVFLGRFSFF